MIFKFVYSKFKSCVIIVILWLCLLWIWLNKNDKCDEMMEWEVINIIRFVGNIIGNRLKIYIRVIFIGILWYDFFVLLC